MSLSVIERAGVRLNEKSWNLPRSGSLCTSDIDQSCPASKRYLTKLTPATPGDVPGSKPTKLYSNLKRPIDMSMTTSDIDWARPKVNRFRTGRSTNPMNPNYDLPSSSPCEPHIAKFSGRDNLNVSDIECAAPKQLVPSYPRRDKEEVEFSAPNYLRRVVRPVPAVGLGNSLNVSDINRGDRIVPEPRLCNPLEPSYMVSQTKCTSIYHAWKGDDELPPLETVVISEIAFNKPLQRYRKTPSISRSLETADIVGSRSQRFVGTQPYNIYSTVRNVNDSAIQNYIVGARSGSFKRGLVTKRCTNPLDPTYQ